MNKLKIPENHSGVSKTLRLPENIADDVQNLANLKNLSFNKTIITLLEFSLSNLEEDSSPPLFTLVLAPLPICVYVLSASAVFFI